MDPNFTAMGHDVKTVHWHVGSIARRFSWELDYLSTHYEFLSLETRMYLILRIFEMVYYPILALVGASANLLTIVILSQGKCGLSKCPTRYLVSMAVADLLVIIIDLILRHIPIVYDEHFIFVKSIPVCNIHAIILFAVTDCSVWFTVAFTFDRFVAICCQKLKCKYCTESVAFMVLGTVTVLSCLKNIFWFFIFTVEYLLSNFPWFCFVRWEYLESPLWATIEFFHHILTPGVPFALVLLLNALTIRHIVVANRARKRLRSNSNGSKQKDLEMKTRKKSIILLFVISANFIVLWVMLLIYSVLERMHYLGYEVVMLPNFTREIGFILQLLNCCTNTCIYAMTQTKFREQMKIIVKYPFSSIVKLNDEK
ncbi:probable G-protein coupled receptor 139 [Stegostoma tigrinum]|uniref:probable G-protein coupled receptor 139 n=1 Tax=Stegostoma tigrinum TaxID=3053191 RepID=UPI00202B5081|nr:probable G-protein coupled receptor 139 [Stegostoma tigrinum]